MAKGAREKIKLESTAGTGHFYTTDIEQEDHDRQARIHEIRPQGS